MLNEHQGLCIENSNINHLSEINALTTLYYNLQRKRTIHVISETLNRQLSNLLWRYFFVCVSENLIYSGKPQTTNPHNCSHNTLFCRHNLHKMALLYNTYCTPTKSQFVQTVTFQHHCYKLKTLSVFLIWSHAFISVNNIDKLWLTSLYV